MFVVRGNNGLISYLTGVRSTPVRWITVDPNGNRRSYDRNLYSGRTSFRTAKKWVLGNLLGAINCEAAHGYIRPDADECRRQYEMLLPIESYDEYLRVFAERAEAV